MKSEKPAGKQKESAQPKVDWKALEIVHPNAAGIDVGGSEHWVAVSPERDPEPVRSFGCFTADLRAMAQWLIEKGVRSVALQSTGVYGMPVFEVLEQQRAVSPTTCSAGGAEGHHRHGAQPRLPVLPAHQTRPAVCGQRVGIL